MSLNYLEFDYSEDTQGIGTFDAMASIAPSQVPAVHAEMAMVLAWALKAFPGGRGPVGDGFDWDYDLQGQREFTASDTLVFDEYTVQLRVTPHPPGTPRHTLTLSVSGGDAFCAAFRARFELG
ncbi:MAG: hypothetical protein V4532_03765 [Pseudomonadota bacterium]